jgi:hypothetical protein
MLRDPYYLQAPAYFWDPLAAVAATGHRVVRLHAGRLLIGTGHGPGLGVTRIGPAGAPVRVALSADAAAFQRQQLSLAISAEMPRLSSPRLTRARGLGSVRARAAVVPSLPGGSALFYPLLAAADVLPGVPVAEPVEEQPDRGAGDHED